MYMLTYIYIYERYMLNNNNNICKKGLEYYGPSWRPVTSITL